MRERIGKEGAVRHRGINKLGHQEEFKVTGGKKMKHLSTLFKKSNDINGRTKII